MTSRPIAESVLLRRLLSVIHLGMEAAEITLRTSIATGQIHRHLVAGPSGRPADVPIGELACGPEGIAGVELRGSAVSMFQSGAQGAELLVGACSVGLHPELATAVDAVDPYGGVGLFAATAMATVGHVGDRVVEVGVLRRQAQPGRPGDDREGGSGPLAGDPGRPVDVVVADPARSGLGKPGADVLTVVAAPVFVLVSCDPVSLARDVTLMAQRGYAPESVEVLDLFPNTPHMENGHPVHTHTDVSMSAGLCPRADIPGDGRCDRDHADLFRRSRDGARRRKAGRRDRVDDLLQPRPAVAGQRASARPLRGGDP